MLLTNVCVTSSNVFRFLIVPSTASKTARPTDTKGFFKAAKHGDIDISIARLREMEASGSQVPITIYNATIEACMAK
jgi:hypothetical protein